MFKLKVLQTFLTLEGHFHKTPKFLFAAWFFLRAHFNGLSTVLIHRSNLHLAFPQFLVLRIQGTEFSLGARLGSCYRPSFKGKNLASVRSGPSSVKFYFSSRILLAKTKADYFNHLLSEFEVVNGKQPFL